MRDTFEWIDGATEDNDDLRHALYDISAQQIGTQAITVAFATLFYTTRDELERLVEKVAGYPGVTGRMMREGSETRVGERATEVAVGLAKLKPNFLR